MTHLAVFFTSLGYEVTFVTCTPNYPYGIPFSGYKNTLLRKEKFGNVNVIRVWSFLSSNKTFWRRILNYGSFSFMAFWGGIAGKKTDILISLSPPLPLGLSTWMLSKLWNVPWILRVEDLFPDAAVAAGYLNSKLASNFFYWLEKFLYKHADRIAVITEGFQSRLISKGVPEEKIEIIPLFADPAEISLLPKNNPLKSELNLDDHFIILYSGNMGLTSSLEDLIYAAGLLSEHEEIRFVLVGEGVRKEDLQKKVIELSLNNITFLPYQPRSRYPELLAMADVSVVTLNPGAAETSLPCKTFNYLASARPILAIAPEDSELAKLIKTEKCGEVVTTGNPGLIASSILKLKQNPDLVTMGLNGRCLVEARFSLSHVGNMFEKCILSLTRN